MGKFRRYKDFLLTLSGFDPQTGAFTVAIPESLEGGQPDPVRQVFPQEELAEDLAAIDEKEIFSEDLQAFGEKLADLLLPQGVIRQRFLSMVQAAGLDEGVRLRLIIRDTGLHQVPWEYAHLPLQDGPDPRLQFLCLNRKVSLVRHIPLDTAAPPLQPGDPAQLRVQVVMANPEAPGLDPLNLRKEKRVLERVFAKFEQEGTPLTWEPILPDARRSDLDDVLKEKPDIFHFSGHGLFDEFDDSARLVLAGETQDEGADFMGAGEIAQRLQAASVRLAFLGACESSRVQGKNPWTGIAPALVVAGVPAVLAMQYEIDDEAAILFSQAFYKALLEGWTIDEAVSEGRQAVVEKSGEDEVEWGVPTLYMRAIDGILFSPQTTRAQSVIPRVRAPAYESELVGRQGELESALANLEQGGKFYLHGAFGIGKTRLASEVFNRLAEPDRYPDGYLWLAAAQLDSAAILESLADSLEIPEVRQAASVPDKKNALRRALAPRRELLIGVDDIGAASVARDLLEAAAGCSVLLNGGEYDLGGLAENRELPPLSAEHGLQLFHQVSELDAGALSQDEQRLASNICATLGYNPKALRLAARYAQQHALQDLDALLQVKPDIFIEVDDQLKALFLATYEEMRTDEPAMALWLRVASFPTYSAPEDHLRKHFGRRAYLEARAALERRELVEVVAGNLVLHPLIGRGLRSVERDACEREQEAAFGFLADLARTHREDYVALDRQRANLLGLLHWYHEEGEWDRLVDLLRPLFHYLRVRGLWQQAFDSLQALCEHVIDLVEPFNQAWVFLHRGIVRTLRSELDPAQADLEEADRRFTAQDNGTYRGKTLYRKAGVAQLRGELPQAADLLQEALELMGDEVPYDLAGAHERLGGIFALTGDPEGAHEHYEKALELGDLEVQGRVHARLGERYALSGEPEKAADHYRQAHSLAEQIGHHLQAADIELHTGYLHYGQGRYTDALAAFRQAQEVFEGLHYQPGLAMVQHALGNLAYSRGELEEAAAYYTNALEASQSGGLLRIAAYSNYQLGVIAHRRGEALQAQELYSAVREIAGRMTDQVLVLAATCQLGSLAYEAGRFDEARRLLEEVIPQASALQDRQAEAVARYYHGMLQAQEGYLEDARQSLALAHAGFAALGSVKADAVQAILAKVERADQEASDSEGAQKIKDSLKDAPPVDDVPSFAAAEAEVDVDVTVDIVGGNVIGIEIDDI